MFKKMIVVWTIIIFAIIALVVLSVKLTNPATHNEYDLKNGVLQKDAIFDSKLEKQYIVFRKEPSTDLSFHVAANNKVDEIIRYKITDPTGRDVTDLFRNTASDKDTYLNLSPTSKAIEDEKIQFQKYDIQLTVKYKKGTRVQ